VKKLAPEWLIFYKACEWFMIKSLTQFREPYGKYHTWVKDDLS